MDKQTPQRVYTDYAVLVVDLDYTLIATDTLLESVLLYLKLHPFGFFLFIGWLLKGKSYFKDQLAQRVCPDATTLPYRQEVLDYIAKAKTSGKPVILATASHHRIANNVAEHLGLFSDVLASDAETNLSGQRKREAILAKIGKKPFAYVGDSSVDIHLWEATETAILVNTSAKIVRSLIGHPKVRILKGEQQHGRLQVWGKAFRVHQWMKNFLLILPAVMAHRIHEIAVLQHLLLAFLSFSLSASSIYLLNDLLDVKADRRHYMKKYRPLAAGTFSVKKALLLMPTFLIISYSIALLMLPTTFCFALFIYLILTSLYSFYLKKQMVIDVILLAALYTLRIIAGAVAVNILVSSWMLAFSMFFFLSLALMKRYSEILSIEDEALLIPGRDYYKGDAETIMISGIASGQLALLIFALYMRAEYVQKLYEKPEMLWLVLPVLFFWITRMWMLAHRGKITEDPLIFTIKDRQSYVSLLLIIIVILIAAFIPVDNFIPYQVLEP